MTPVEQKIAQLETDMATAFNRRDVEAILAHFDDQFAGFSSTKHERLRKFEALRKTFAYYLEQSERAEFEVDEILVQVFDTTAISSFYWTVTITRGNRQHEIHGRGSHVFIQKNGEWKIVHEHFSRSHQKPELWDTSPG
jgi:ketosteroid isomerase-like protein